MGEVMHELQGVGCVLQGATPKCVCDEGATRLPAPRQHLGGKALSSTHTHANCNSAPTHPLHSTSTLNNSKPTERTRVETNTHIHNTPTSTTPALLVLPHASGALVHCCCWCCCWRRCITALLNAVSRGPSCAWACRQDQNPGRRGVATPSPVGASRSRCGTIVKGVKEVHVVCGGECVVEGAAVCCYCCCC